MDFDLVVQQLKQFQINEASRQVAHSEIAPFRDHNITSVQSLNAKKAGVLLLVHNHENKPYFTLIERSSYEGIHSKQIALPGGKVEPEDLNMTTTALREAQEEVNINPLNVTIIGFLSNVFVIK